MIELRHLRYFIAVAEELNFRRASERVHIDQTPLSRTIRDLEQQLGAQLFLRGGGKLILSPAGLQLQKDARKVLLRVERAQCAVRETYTRFRAPLRIGVADDIAQPKLCECFVRWREIAPEVRIEVTELRAAELATALQREELDAGFSFGLPYNEALVEHPTWSYGAIALLARGHQLAIRAELSLSELTAVGAA